MGTLSLRKWILPALLIVLLGLLSPPVWGEEPPERPYDAYTHLLRAGAKEDPHKPRPLNWLDHTLDLPAWPLDAVRVLLDESIYTVEHHRLDKKAKWIYEKLTDYGIYPKLQNLTNFGDFGAGVDLDFVKLARQRSRVPYLRARGGIAWASSELFRVHSELGIDKVQEIGPYGSFNFNYEDRPEEDFFGIGPNTSLGDGTSFNSEITTLEIRFGYSMSLNTDLRARFAYKNANITNGEDEGKGIIDLIFPGRVPGLAGGEFLIAGLELARDSRDFPDDPHKGNVLGLQVSYHEGVAGSDFGFLKYRAEAARYQEIFSDRQVIAIRLLGEHNDELNDRDIPFFEMARLGGYGVRPSLGDTHRGFQKNRFFGESSLLMNLEYRYRVWAYRDLAMDAVIFWDEGQVFNELAELQFKDFRESIGGGFRFKALRKSILSVELAHSDEGFEFYARSDTPF